MNSKENKKASSSNEFLFDRQNYILLITGIVICLLGFLLMMGGETTDPNVFNADELYSFRRITIAPILILVGLGLEIYAIMKKPGR